MVSYFADLYYSSFDIFLSQFRDVLGCALFFSTLILPILFAIFFGKFIVRYIKSKKNNVSNAARRSDNR